MTYTPFDTQTFLTTTLPRIHPRPADAYEAALHSRDLAYVFEELHLGFIEQYHTDIRTIRDENCQSTAYQIIWPEKTYYEVDIQKLRTDHPDLHQKLVHLRATDAEKILGRDYLYTAAKERLGTTIQTYEKITITDLKKHLTAHDLPHYLTPKTRPLSPEIIPRQEAY
ncbi:MAG TPA: hypothetical protein O0Y06_00380 [Methanocorpusculum sp.]|nr:hypothetical protein [Methanocorpusculum sp.]HJK79342.1 hypothetical protein [Methanocorpusculum sp.]